MTVTDAFRNALVAEASAGVMMGPIDTFCLYNDTVEVMCHSLTATDISVDTGNDKIVIRRNIVNTTGDTLTFNKIYIKSGTTVYFITDVVPTAVPPESLLIVTWEFNISGGGLITGHFNRVDMSGLIDMLLRILGRVRGTKDKIFLHRFSYIDTGYYPVVVLLGVSPTRSVAGTKVTASHPLLFFATSGTLRECWILNDLRASDNDSAAVVLKVFPAGAIGVDTTKSVRATVEVVF